MKRLLILVFIASVWVGCGPGDGTDGGSDTGATDGGGSDATTSDSGGTDIGVTDSGATDASFATPIPLTLWNWRPVVMAEAAGEPPLPYLVDTGAPTIILDTDYYMAAAGSYTVDITVFGDFWMAEQAIVFNLFGSYPGPLQSAAGIIGATFLLPRVLTLDYQNLGAYLFPNLAGDPPVNAATGATVTVPFTIEGGGGLAIPGDGMTSVPPNRIIVSGMVEGTPVVILLDTGTRHTIIDENLFAALGDPSRPILDGINVQSAGGIVAAMISRVDDLTVGGATVNGESVLIIPGTGIFSGVQAETGMNVEMLLGSTFLRHFLTTIDYPDSELLLAPYSSSSHIDPDEWMGPGFEVNAPLGGGFIIHDVYAGTDAESAGVPEDSELLSIDGTSVSGMTLDQVRAMLRSVPLGNTVDIEADDGGGVQVYSVVSEDLLPAYP